MKPNPFWTRALTCLALTAAIFATFWETTNHDFINLDDPDYVSKNPIVQSGLNHRSISWALAEVHSSNWHPITWMSHMFDCSIYGLNPSSHHLMNLALHAANSLLLLGFLYITTNRWWRCVLVAALFALHPLHVESVAWISERKDVLSAFFGLLTLIAYAKYAARLKSKKYAQIIWYGLSLLCFALGLMSKPMLVTWPFVMVLMDLWPLKRIEVNYPSKLLCRIVIEKIPFLALSIAVSIITFRAQEASGSTVALGSLDVATRLANSIVAYATYLVKTIWPENLSVFYPYRELSWNSISVWIALLTLIMISWLVFRLRNCQPYLMVGWLWFLGMLVPVIGLIQVGRQSMADRYTYLPLIGVFLGLVWLICDTMEKRQIPIGVRSALGLALLVICAFFSSRQLTYWQDTITLASRAIQVNSNNYLAHAQLAAAFAEEGRLDDAAAECHKSLLIKPDFAEAFNVLATISARRGSLGEAVTNYSQAIQLDPYFPDARYGLGETYFRLGDYSNAERYSREALVLSPYHVGAKYTLAQVLQHQGRLDEAAVAYESLIRLHPDTFAFYWGLASTLALRGELAAAKIEFQKALRLSPEDANVHVSLGLIALAQNDMSTASNHFSLALTVQPTNPISNFQVATLLAENNMHESAVNHYRVALASQPDWPEALNNYAWLLATCPNEELRDADEAIELAERACQLTDGKRAQFLGTLAAAYAEAGRFEEAVKTAEMAVVRAKESGEQMLARRNLELLELYKAKKPFHEP